jgi:hypothetical protein
VAPAFPRRWNRRIDGILHGGVLRLMLLRVQLEQRRAALAQAFSAFPWRRLNLANLVYVVLDRDLERRVVATDHELLGGEQATGPTAANGPQVSFADEREMLAHLARLWQRSSRQLDRLARANGTRYYHFLQPNQYVPGSKPMGPGERATAVNTGSSYGRLVTAGYPLLQRAGRELEAEGVRFADLTAVFADHDEAVYIDACCHVSDHGNAIVAERIFEIMKRDLPPQPTSHTR